MGTKKLPNIITKTGDNGKSSSFDGIRVSKGDDMFLLLAALDTFDASLGIAKNKSNPYIIIDSITKIQDRLIYFKGEIATVDNKDYPKNHTAISDVDIDYLEKSSFKLKEFLEGEDYEIKGWVLYGDEGEASAWFDYCRALCRQCEVSLVKYNKNYREPLFIYLNRLSDYLYWCARFLSSI